MADLERIEEALRAADAAGDAEAAARLAAAYREAQAAQQGTAAGPGTANRAFIETAADIARPINTGLTRPLGFDVLPEGARSYLAEKGIINDPNAPPTSGQRGLEVVGESAPLAVAGPAAALSRFATTRVPQAISQAVMNARPPSLGGGLIHDIAETAVQRPGAFYGGEAGGAFGAGALDRMAEEGGAGPVGRMGSALVGNVAGTMPAMAIPRGARAFRDALMANLAPMTTEGGTVRAARQMQARAGSPERARHLARQLDDMPADAGMTPARYLGDETLMAQEARMLADDPDMAARTATVHERAHLAGQQALKDQFGRPRSRQEWERTVIERVAAPGAEITPGHTDEMLDQAYRSFEPMYRAARGHKLGQFVQDGDKAIPLGRHIVKSVDDPDILSDPASRKRVGGWLKNQYDGIARRADADGKVTTDDLLTMRSRVRTEQRNLRKRQDHVGADLLGAAESRLTRTIERALPDDALANLRAADQQYRTYKVVEDALYRSADLPLTPEMLSASIRDQGLTSPGRYARGVDETTQQMRQMAMGGRSTEEVFGDPRRAALMVRGLDEPLRKAVHADFADVLFRRARSQSQQSVEATGEVKISGRQLLRDLHEQREVAKALGISPQEYQRMQRFARDIARLEQASPQAVAQLFEDGPATLSQLAAALVGAKSGSNIAGSGMGSQLVLAQFMSNKARRALATMTSDKATELMNDAVWDRDLYRALLTKNVAPVDRQKEAAQLIEAWLIPVGGEVTADETRRNDQ